MISKNNSNDLISEVGCNVNEDCVCVFGGDVSSRVGDVDTKIAANTVSKTVSSDSDPELDLLVAELLSLSAGKHRLRHKDKIRLLQYAGSFANLWRLLQEGTASAPSIAKELGKTDEPSELNAPSEQNEPKELELLRLIVSRADIAGLRYQVKKWLEQGIGVVSVLDPRFPASLNNSVTSVSVLYYRGGNLSLLKKDAAAIVGSRALTAYGHQATAILAKNLCRKGYCLVSGAAEGADTAAHQAALDISGETIAVLGCGVDIAYPGKNRKLLREISEGGLVISEYKPGTPPIGRNFPARNRIIAALADFVVVTSAKVKSGSLITAQMAHKLGRQVYAVPGSIFDAAQRGCHSLIEDGTAKIVTDLTMPDLQTLPDYPDVFPAEKVPNTEHRQLTFISQEYSESETKILRLLTTGAKTLEQISQETGLSVPETAQIITKLEIAYTVNMRRGHYELTYQSP